MTEDYTQKTTVESGVEMSEQQEQWREVVGYPGYEVSDAGRVRSWKRRGPGDARRTEPLIVKQVAVSGGYLKVILSIDGKAKNLRVSRLVLITFTGEEPDGMEACHNNGDPTDNRLSNLRWDTHRNNVADRALHGTERYGSDRGNSKLTEEIVREARGIYIPWHREFGTTALARRYGVSQRTMSMAIRGDTWSKSTPQDQGLAA